MRSSKYKKKKKYNNTHRRFLPFLSKSTLNELNDFSEEKNEFLHHNHNSLLLFFVLNFYHDSIIRYSIGHACRPFSTYGPHSKFKFILPAVYTGSF